MKNQKGVTLVELLVIITVMGIIFVPISNMLLVSLKSEKEVSIKNDVQRETRLIMEIVTAEMRDLDIEWDTYGTGSKKLTDTKDARIILEYHEPTSNSKGIMEKDGVILSENIKEFTVTEDLENDLINIKLIIQKSDFEFELQGNIIHPDIDRFRF
jgi:hypothetical protein